MATDVDDEIYSDSPSNEVVKNVRLIRTMFEVPKKTETPTGKNSKPTGNGINGCAKLLATPETSSSKTGSQQKTTKAEVHPPPTPKKTQKQALDSRPSVMPKQSDSNCGYSGIRKGTSAGIANGAPSVLRTPISNQNGCGNMEPVKTSKARISSCSSNRSTVFPPTSNVEYGIPVLPKRNNKSDDLVVSGVKNYRKIPFISPKTPAPRKKPLPPELPRDFARKLMEQRNMAKTTITAKASAESDNLLPYEDLYEDASSYLNQN